MAEATCKNCGTQIEDDSKAAEAGHAAVEGWWHADTGFAECDANVSGAWTWAAPLSADAHPVDMLLASRSSWEDVEEQERTGSGDG